LTEGKFSFPIIHAIRSDPANLQLLNILKQKTTDEEVKRYAVKYMESKGSFEYCKKVVKTLGERARKLVVEVVEVESESEGESAKEGGKGSGVLKILEKMVI
jgi:geranylgeranyl diphosphate synthase, type III